MQTRTSLAFLRVALSDDYQDTFGSGDNGWISSDEAGLHGHFQDSFSVESLRSFYYVSAITEYSRIQTSQHAMKTQTDRTFNPFQASFAADFKENVNAVKKKNKKNFTIQSSLSREELSRSPCFLP